MCLYKKTIFPRISTHPIICYKILSKGRDGGLYTPCCGVKVKIGDTVESKLPAVLGIFSGVINGEGVHAYSTKKGAITNAFMDIGDEVYECVIPPYTFYYEGGGEDTNTIAAGKIKIGKRVWQKYEY